ncbi:uncharacterized protein F4812DRAFT_419872 [Daldinia caldariorum]|uniref:uncharacterized protein n=1 Tax=Daldinia caldariorum TaxID=326644 RepID=UPI0020077F8C|nr:uncharacterized protein F4812DRAFT_419872 [Daldinia caldariorum]KAI1469661.1 hypothetical protein F4812DRAFT_419872 [Daldinia caldariorum]
MPGERIVFDGLWRCLCPSADIFTLSSLSCRRRGSRQRSILSPGSNAHVSGRLGRRGYHFEYDRIPVPPPTYKPHDNYPEDEKVRIEYLKRVAKRTPWVPGELFNNVENLVPQLQHIPTETIYAALKELARVQDTYWSTVKLVEYLVKERKEKPNTVLYECLIRANVDKSRGSAEVAGRLLEEMRKLRVPTTAQIYQAILEVTAVHPDYVLRNTALFEMKNRWYSPTTEDSVNIVIGLLRDNQYELALEKLEELGKTSLHIPLWLYDIFLYTFGDLGFHEEALSILKHRMKVENLVKEPLSLNSWQFLLDVFSRDAFYEGIKFIWDRSVSPGYINPPDGTVLNIINAASNHADASLAISAIQMLSNRGKKLELHHYEALVDIHAQQNELSKAFTTLCISAKADLRPSLSSTRSIYRVLRNSPEETDKALAVLNDLRLHHRVPAAAFNVVLEATELHHGFQAALDLYRSVRQICADGPDLETYHILFSHCTMRKSMNFLFAEMQNFSIEPTQATYDHLVRISSMQDNYEQAFAFLEKMQSCKTGGIPNNWWISRDSALALIRRCIHSEDIRAQELIEECRKRGMSVDKEVQRLLEATRERKESEEIAFSTPIKQLPSTAADTTIPLQDAPSPEPKETSGWI